MVFFASAANLMTMFLALEWFSISLYVLCALDTHRRESLEAGLKYLIVGSFGSGILLFGCALVYGATGELGFAAIREATGADDPLFVTGMAMILAGLAFKVSAAPFHMWTPDVYQGAPTTVTAFMAAATKVAALVLTLRILVTAFPEQDEIWTIAVAVLAVASLVIGNLAAIAQRDLKRLLAYSSVSHAGFLLIAIAADNADGGTALLYYLIPYCAATVGAFAVVAARERELAQPVTLSRLEGLGWERPFLGIAMWWFMLSMAGFPLTGGFLGKLFVFSAVYEAGWWWLVVIGVLATALSPRVLPQRREGALHALGRGRRDRRRGGRLTAARPPARRRRGRCARRHDRLVLLRAAARRPRARRGRLAALLTASLGGVRYPAHRVPGAEVGDPGRVERADRERAPVGGEGQHVGQHPPVGEHLGWVADRVDERLVEPVPVDHLARTGQERLARGAEPGADRGDALALLDAEVVGA